MRILEAIKGTTNTKQIVDTRRFNQSKAKSSSLISTSGKCIYCGGTHSIVNCTSFCDANITPQMRFQFIRYNK